MFNINGLTFARWWYAANFARLTPVPFPMARRAWQAGEDPCNYSAS